MTYAYGIKTRACFHYKLWPTLRGVAKYHGVGKSSLAKWVKLTDEQMMACGTRNVRKILSRDHIRSIFEWVRENPYLRTIDLCNKLRTVHGIRDIDWSTAISIDETAFFVNDHKKRGWVDQRYQSSETRSQAFETQDQYFSRRICKWNDTVRVESERL